MPGGHREHDQVCLGVTELLHNALFVACLRCVERGGRTQRLGVAHPLKVAKNRRSGASVEGGQEQEKWKFMAAKNGS